MTDRLCECGCGQAPRPGRRFVRSHQVRMRPKAQPPRYGTCPRCGRKVRLRVDGGYTKHERRGGLAPVVCTEGLIGKKPAPVGVRVRITLDVIIPSSWSRIELQRNVRAALQEQAEAAFLIATETENDDERTRT